MNAQPSQLSLFSLIPPPALAMPSRRCETCPVWGMTCGIPGKVTAYEKDGSIGPDKGFFQAQEYNKKEAGAA
jgi:hypothetical protein